MGATDNEKVLIKVGVSKPPVIVQTGGGCVFAVQNSALSQSQKRIKATVGVLQPSGNEGIAKLTVGTNDYVVNYRDGESVDKILKDIEDKYNTNRFSKTNINFTNNTLIFETESLLNINFALKEYILFFEIKVSKNTNNISEFNLKINNKSDFLYSGYSSFTDFVNKVKSDLASVFNSEVLFEEDKNDANYDILKVFVSNPAMHSATGSFSDISSDFQFESKSNFTNIFNVTTNELTDLAVDTIKKNIYPISTVSDLNNINFLSNDSKESLKVYFQQNPLYGLTILQYNNGDEVTNFDKIFEYFLMSPPIPAKTIIFDAPTDSMVSTVLSSQKLIIPIITDRYFLQSDYDKTTLKTFLDKKGKILPLYHENLDLAFGIAGFIGGLNFYLPNTAFTINAKTLEGVKPSLISSTDIQKLKRGTEKEAVLYYSESLGYNMVFGSQLANGQYLDSVLYQDHILAVVKSRLVGLMNNSIIIPYNNRGINYIKDFLTGVVRDVILISGIIMQTQMRDKDGKVIFLDEGFMFDLPNASSLVPETIQSRVLNGIMYFGTSHGIEKIQLSVNFNS